MGKGGSRRQCCCGHEGKGLLQGALLRYWFYGWCWVCAWRAAHGSGRAGGILRDGASLPHRRLPPLHFQKPDCGVGTPGRQPWDVPLPPFFGAPHQRRYRTAACLAGPEPVPSRPAIPRRPGRPGRRRPNRFWRHCAALADPLVLSAAARPARTASPHFETAS
ncbi:hypothetical protein RR42_s0354 [Cupriavidus basilensis]|uniref:Uncharacterized protein n=1 Tax=Cupriavidus basilensis TaxID=68895 RepID=A0A0C4YGW2_9BURK|nr:hypothetical protein RR42_s0354 [Cupriavidus basilensis]